MNIYQKMSEVTEAIGTIPKNLTVGTGKNQYKAVAEKDVLAAVKAAEKAAGIYSFPLDHRIVESKSIVSKTDYGEKESQFVRIEATYRFVNLDNPDEYVDVKAYGDGCDSLDKAPGKATTYADKYALMKAYKIETGDDTDNSASDDLSGHDILKIKNRVERLVSDKLHGMPFDEMLKRLKITEKQFNSYMNTFASLDIFEKALRQL